MPTKDGKEPTTDKMYEDSKALEKEVNRLIQEFKAIYNEPAITLIQGDKYVCQLQVRGDLLRQQYGNFSDAEYILKAPHEE